MMQDHPDQDLSTIGDSTAMTIEFLRARLLAERSVSKTARQRADELAKRVVELEEQLKIVSLQRKKAEKATADVLAILEDNGVSDFSEDIDSSTDQDIPHFESIMGSHYHREEFPGSEVEPSPSTARSLSWKSGKDSPSSNGKKEYPSRRRSPFTPSSSYASPIRTAGKSCRRIRQRETRLAVEESQTKYNTHSYQENGDTAHTECFNAPHVPDNNAENRDLEVFVKGSRNLENRQPETNVSSFIDVNGSDRDMERALERQAQLIVHYEEEEKAQAEWEEKFRENNDSQDPYEPGTTHSDITEERDETKTDTPPYPVGSSDPIELKENKVTFDNKKSSTSEMNGHRQPQVPPQSDVAYSPGERNSSTTVDTKSHELIPSETPVRVGSVLEALQQAKKSLTNKLSALPLSSNGGSPRKAIEYPTKHMPDVISPFNGGSQKKSIEFPSKDDRPEVPVGCPALFRVPSDFYSEGIAQNNFTGLNSRLSWANHSDQFTSPISTYMDNNGSQVLWDPPVTWPRSSYSNPPLGPGLGTGFSYPNDYKFNDLNINRGVPSSLEMDKPHPSSYVYNGRNGDASHGPSSYSSPTYPLFVDPMSRLPSGGDNQRVFSSTGAGALRPDLSYYDQFRPYMYR